MILLLICEIKSFGRGVVCENDFLNAQVNTLGAIVFYVYHLSNGSFESRLAYLIS